MIEKTEEETRKRKPSENLDFDEDSEDHWTDIEEDDDEEFCVDDSCSSSSDDSDVSIDSELLEVLEDAMIVETISVVFELFEVHLNVNVMM